MVDLHKSGSSLGAISKRLKVASSSVQTIVCKYKHHGTTQPSYHSGRICVMSPRDERTWCVKRIYTVDGSDLEYVDNYKYLGVWLDCKLSFQTHIKHLQSKIKSRIGFQFRKKSILPISLC
jgi:transposase